jgi:dienelactone hydrolase
MTLLVLLLAAPAAPIDWPALVQKPHAHLAVADLGLRPLLVTADGKKVTTKAEWDQARQALHDAWMERLGKPPARPDRLDVRVEQTEKLDGYTRRLLSFHSEGDDRTRAYLLTPDGLKGKRPAVVVFHATNRDTFKEAVGLSNHPGLDLAVQLVRRGYVTLSPECYILKAGGTPSQADAMPRAQSQADALAKRRPGWTGLGKMTFDASRCVDFLETLPEVDGDRIGCIGHSLGAKEVLYAMAFEPRYRAGVFNEGGLGLRMSNWTDPWYLTAAMKLHIPAMENHQVLALAAPRPLLVLGGGDGSGARNSAADGEASWALIKAVLPVYELLGAADRVGLALHGGRHSFPREARRLGYRWLDHWLRFTPARDEVGG